MADLTALLLNCTLKPSSASDRSSTGKLLGEVATALESHGVAIDGPVRLADLDIKPGVTSDEGEGDDWPDIRRRILDAQILVLGTPIWVGHPSSIAQRVIERMDAFLGEEDDQGRMVSYDRVAVVAVVGNEDGAHHVSAELFQGLNDLGFTIPASGVTYWNGEAMQKTDYVDVPGTPKATATTTALVARHAAHLARALASEGYPPPG
jgi:multimeric flavodoxin WrbA